MRAEAAGFLPPDERQTNSSRDRASGSRSIRCNSPTVDSGSTAIPSPCAANETMMPRLLASTTHVVGAGCGAREVQTRSDAGSLRQTDDRLRREFGKRQRRHLGQRMIRRHSGHQSFVGDHPRFEPFRQLARHPDDGYVEGSVQHSGKQTARIVLGQRNVQSGGVFVVQPTEQICEVGGSAGGNHPDRNGTPNQSVQGIDSVAGALNGSECSVGVREDSSPGVGQTNGSTTTIEQFLPPQLTFQPFDLRTHTRLGYVKPLGGASEVGFLHYRDKVFELPKFHNC